MSRSERLLDLLQVLRRHRLPVSGRTLAGESGVSLRTVYRDIASLRAQGAPIEGEPGIGYSLRPGFDLPPLMFSPEEIEALVLGSRWVANRADDQLGAAARNALAKIAAVLPPERRDDLDATPLLVGPTASVVTDRVDISVIRQAIRAERKLGISYHDANGTVSERIIWPFAIGFFDCVCMVAAWCELRNNFRHFRTDRISALAPIDRRYPRRRQALLKEWRQIEGIPPSP
jgi:predicted DNA-binding transcriptional regulator YafY